MGVTKQYTVMFVNDEMKSNKKIERLVNVSTQSDIGEPMPFYPLDVATTVYDEISDNNEHVAMLSITLNNGQPTNVPQIEIFRGDYFKKPIPFVNNGENYYTDIEQLMKK